MNRRITIIMFSILLLVSTATHVSAGIVGGTTTITSIGSLSAYGDGDVYIIVATPVPGCEAGYWLPPSDPGFKTNLALLVSAMLSAKTSLIQGDSDHLWPGSGGHYCHMYSIQVYN